MLLFHFPRVLHQLSHLIEAADQIVYLRDGRAAAARDPLTTPRIQNVGTRPLLAGHRKHDGFGALELLLVNREAGNVTHAGDHAKHIFERAHFAEHPELAEEVVEIEGRAAQFLFEPRGVFDLDRLSGFFHQADHIAHAENPPRQALGHEGFELIQFLPYSDKLDWTLRHFAHRQSRPASRVAIEPGQNDSGYLQSAVEMSRNADRLLTGRRIDNQQCFLWLQKSFQLLQLLNQRDIDLLPARRVENFDIAPRALMPLER